MGMCRVSDEDLPRDIGDSVASGLSGDAQAARDALALEAYANGPGDSAVCGMTADEERAVRMKGLKEDFPAQYGRVEVGDNGKEYLVFSPSIDQALVGEGYGPEIRRHSK
ncbi:MAG: hypothetical protein IT342_15290 [Candidatus Melainabacteria bacterium]|nr:hypothetical protein [Candidatus Melainabacteria bacterium]